HEDVSLFTIFPFGFDSDFQYQNRGSEWQKIPATTDIVIFPESLLESFTNGEIKALNHKVVLPKTTNEKRFSFAYFLLPYPKREFTVNGKKIRSEDYFENYLALF
ncbi:MAG: isopenicillin N synthase-like dioxygenase, partial [Salibacteraceae bacterium]